MNDAAPTTDRLCRHRAYLDPQDLKKVWHYVCRFGGAAELTVQLLPCPV